MALYKINELDILDVCKHLDITLTINQIKKAVIAYDKKKAVEPNLNWYQIIEHVVNDIINQKIIYNQKLLASAEYFQKMSVERGLCPCGCGIKLVNTSYLDEIHTKYFG